MYDQNVGRFAQLLRRLFNIKGETPLGVEALVVPTLDIEGGAPENYWLRREMLCHGRATQGAVAAQFTQVSLKPPIAQVSYVAVVDRVSLWTSASGGVRIQVGPALPGAGLTAVQGIRDSRWQNQGPLTTWGRGTNAAQSILAGFAWVYVPANTPVEVPGPWVIEGFNPQWSLNFEKDTVNQDLNVTAFWRERLLEPTEVLG